MIVPLRPIQNDPARLFKRLELMLPDAFFVETPKEPLNDPILLLRKRCEELLLQSIVTGSVATLTALEDQPVVAAEDKYPPSVDPSKQP